MGRKNKLAYLIVTYNGEKTIGPLLNSIPDKDNVFVVDNASTDQTAEIVPQHNVTCTQNAKNIGYAGAINQGLKTLMERYEYVFILNQDMILGKTNYNWDLFSRYAIVQPLILLPDGTVNVDRLVMNIFGYVYPSHYRQCIAHLMRTEEMFFFSGASFIINMQKYLSIGPLDETLFLYYEDVDYAFRLFLKGEKVLFYPQLVTQHDYNNTFLQWGKKRLLKQNRKVVVARYFRDIWRCLIFVYQREKNGLSAEKKMIIWQRLKKELVLGFYTKQIPFIRRFLINLILVPYSFLIRCLL